MMRVLTLVFFGMLLTGCYTSSFTVVGLATGVAQGKLSETALSTTVNYSVKKTTGKSPIEHVLSEKQIKTINSNKAKIDPCNKNNELCVILNSRIEKMQKQLMGLNLQSRIEKKHKTILKNKKIN